ncbi:sensor domain-containing diguanylate cyclase [Variovorax terrae]|uniref:Diguanylate cyclase n=1 Tax=Variovorax terrae TaxID=2923278 RepID=A0A9X1VWY2_9BURK|nr:7TM diverse intracellular signaling domain-containing protein [Variovorax terrae]MCJ0762053.1 diguanylate cyclase [Variovorax terrae]
MRCPKGPAARALAGLWQRGWPVWLLLLALAIAGPAQARSGKAAVAEPPALAAIVLDDRLSTLDVATRGEAWVDPAGTASFEQVLAAGAEPFAPVQAGRVDALGAQGALWLHWRVTLAPTAAAGPWMLEFPLPYLDSVALYQQNASGAWQAQLAGDTVEMAAWPEAGRYPSFRLNLAPGQTRDLYARVNHLTPLSLPARLSTEASHDTRQQLEYLGLGIVFGALLLLIVACTVQSWAYRDPTYAWYALYAAITMLAVAAYTGVAGHLLWGTAGRWADTAQGFLALLAGACALLFMRKLSSISRRYPRLDRALQWLGVGGLVLALAYVTLERSTTVTLLGLYLTSVALINVAAALLIWRRGDVVGLWMATAYAPMALAVLLAMVRVFGWVPFSWLAQYAVVIAMALEVPLLLVALNIRSRERHSAEVRAQALSSQDALTGLLAAHLFQDRLRQVVHRHQRDRESAAIVLIDLVNYQRIKDFHGPAVAEQSLLRSVIKLRRLLRDVDTTSRVGEARFGLIMEGVSSRTVVTDRAARLIAAGLMPLKGLKPEVTLQFHIAAVLLCERSLEPAALNEALGELLSGMSGRTRRPIRFLEPEATRPLPLEQEQDSQTDALDDGDSTLPQTA